MEITPQHVVVTDVKIPFMSMVVLLVKWALAAIPAVDVKPPAASWQPSVVSDPAPIINSFAPSASFVTRRTPFRVKIRVAH